MFATETLDDIRRRKRVLVARSDVHRAMLQLEFVRLRPNLAYLETGANLFKRSRPLWMVAAPVIGLWVARRLKPVVTWLPTAFVVWKTAQKGLALWRRFQQSLSSSEGSITPAVAVEEL
jgi:hypothetical protein